MPTVPLVTKKEKKSSLSWRFSSSIKEETKWWWFSPRELSLTPTVLSSRKVKVAQLCPTLQHHGLYSPWNSPGWNTGLVSLSLLQAIFPTQGSNPGLPHCRWILHQLSHKGSPRIQILEWVAYPLCSRSSQSRNGTGVSCIAGGLSTNWAIREACVK